LICPVGGASRPHDLVRLTAHDRSRQRQKPVVSLREIADSTISPRICVKNWFIRLQKFVEVDEPEPDTVP